MTRFLASIILLIISSSNLYAGEVARLMENKSASEQGAILKSVVTSSGGSCDIAKSFVYKGEAAGDGNDFWVLNCTSGSYVVQIRNDSKMTSSSMSCSRASSLGLSICE